MEGGARSDDGPGIAVCGYPCTKARQGDVRGPAEVYTPHIIPVVAAGAADVHVPGPDASREVREHSPEGVLALIVSGGPNLQARGELADGARANGPVYPEGHLVQVDHIVLIGGFGYSGATRRHGLSPLNPDGVRSDSKLLGV